MNVRRWQRRHGGPGSPWLLENFIALTHWAAPAASGLTNHTVPRPRANARERSTSVGRVLPTRHVWLFRLWRVGNTTPREKGD